MAKQVKSAGDLDRISNLPDPILTHILSFLTSEEAIRTSILSSKWRYVFTSMPSLDFDRIWNLSERNVENFKNFLDRLFSSSNEIGLERFRLWAHKWGADCLHGWIFAALSRGVKELVLCSVQRIMFPDLLFSSHTLVTLKLRFYNETRIPTDASLPNLKTLHLHGGSIFKDADSFHRLIFNCLALEDLDVHIPSHPPKTTNIMIHKLSLKRLVLTFFHHASSIHGRDFNYAVEISAPNLICFYYADTIANGYTISNMASLEEAHITACPFAEYNVNRDQGAIHLLQGICNVQSLLLNVDYAGALFGTSLEPLFTFHNLIELELKNRLGDWKGTWIMEFLNCVPNLKKLTLDLVVAEDGFQSVPSKVPLCLLSDLKKIEISRFRGVDRDMFKMIHYFLNHSVVLEELIIRSERPNQLKQVLRLPRSSKKCRVVTAKLKHY